MKKNIIYLIFIPIIIILILLCQNLLLNNKIKECQTKENASLENTNDKKEQSQIIVSTNIYDCKFTVTYRIADLLDGYIAEVPEYSSIVVDKFQQHLPIAHKIPTKLKTNLEINKYYEFTYYIKGIGNVEDIYDVINNIHINHTNNDNISVTLSIKETTKLGLEQIQQNICN